MTRNDALARYVACLKGAIRLLASRSRAAAWSEKEEFATACDSFVGALDALNTKGTWRLSLNPNLRIRLKEPKLVKGNEYVSIYIGASIEGRNHRICEQSVVSAIVVPRNAELRTPHDLQCCIQKRFHKSQPVIVRRVHWDYDIAPAKSAPISHVQVGGRASSSVGAMANAHHCSWHDYEAPRIAGVPYDLILVLDLIVRQLDTPLRDLQSHAEWQSFVNTAESIWITPYLSALVNTPSGKRQPWHTRITQVDVPVAPIEG